MLDSIPASTYLKCKNEGKSVVKKEDQQLARVPTSPAFGLAIEHIMNEGTYALKGFPEWRAKFVEMMAKHFGAEEPDQDTSAEWECMSEEKEGHAGEEYEGEEHFGVQECAFAPTSTASAAVRRTSPPRKTITKGLSGR